MAVLQMQKVSICALKKDRKAILEKIQAMGVMEISKMLEDETWTVFFLYSIMKMYFIMQNYIPQYETFGKNSCQEESR